MLSFITGIMQGMNQARAYSAQARIKRAEGKAALNAANAQASAIESAAALNQDLAGQQMRTVRANQTAARDAARNIQARSGFTSQGTGNQLERTTSQNFDEKIALMAQSASIDYTNAWQNSIDTRRQGQLQNMVANAEADSLARTAKIVRKQTQISGWIGGITAVASAIAGFQGAEAFNATNAQSITAGTMDSINPYANAFLSYSDSAGNMLNNLQGLNPYTAGATRKQNWGSFLSLLKGNTPGYQHNPYIIN